MKGVVPFYALVLFACASRQGTDQQTSKEWKPVEVAELRGECVASYIDRGLAATRAKALCGCAIPRLTEIFSYTWFNDGQPMSPDELKAMSGVYQACAKNVLNTDAPSAMDSEVEPSPDTETSQVEL
jgi:hypothetical protein